MRRCVWLLLVVAACHGTATSSTPAPLVDVAPTRSPLLVDGDLHGFEPTDELVRWASRLGDADDRGKASVELTGLPAGRRVAILRAGIRLRDATAARTCAGLLLWNELDDWEQGLTTRLLTDAAVDPDWRDAAGERVGFPDFFERVSGAELPYILDRIAQRQLDDETAQHVAVLHKVASAEHIPQLAAVAASSGGTVREQMFDILMTVIVRTDQHRDDVGAALLGLSVDEARRRFPYTGDGVPPLLVEVLRLKTMPFEPQRTDFRSFVWRWLADTRPSRRDVDLLLELDADPRGGMNGRDSIPWILRDVDDPRIDAWLRATEASSPVRTAALVVRGDREAVARLVTAAQKSYEALNLLLAVAPKEGRALVERDVFGNDPETAQAALERLRRAWCEGATSTGVAWDEAVFASFDAVALACHLDGPRLAAVGVSVPGCRTRAIAEATVAALPRDKRSEDADAFDLDGDVGPFLETAAPEAFRDLLRAWARSSDETTRKSSLRSLALIGDPQSGPQIVDALRDGQVRLDSLSVLARSACPEVFAFLRERAVGDFGAAVACGVAAGMPEEVGVYDVCTDEAFPSAARDEARTMLLDGRWKDAVATALAAAPDPDAPGHDIPFENVHLVDDDRVRAYLRRLQEHREFGRYPWATAELAMMGDPIAGAEFERVIRIGRYRWLDGNERIALGNPVAALPMWLDLIETNCCRFATVKCFLFDHWFDFDFYNDEGGPSTPVAEARRWFGRSGGRFVRSRLAERMGHPTFVPAPR